MDVRGCGRDESRGGVEWWYGGRGCGRNEGRAEV